MSVSEANANKAKKEGNATLVSGFMPLIRLVIGMLNKQSPLWREGLF
jgi:hypothetical protein